MSKKGGNFFEQHVEKMVLAVIGVVCLWLGVTRFFLSPNKVSYDGQNYSPASIDNHLSDQADVLEDKLKNLPPESRTYEPRLVEFAARIESAIDVDRRLVVPVPAPISDIQIGNRRYGIPAIGEVKEVAVEHIRAAAYLPTVDVGEETNYEQAASEPNDIDFVTVEAKFDVASLYKDFYENFAGEDVPPEWRDPCLAKPVFAAVLLQRQELLSDGTWADWRDVPRTRIDVRKVMFEIVEDVENLPPGGVRVRMLQFDRRDVCMDLLQPEAYRIASAEEEWFPPSLHKKYAKWQKKEEAQERRQAKEEEKQEQERKREEALRERGRYGPEIGRYSGREGGRYEDRESSRYGGRDRGRYGEYGPRGRQSRRDRSTGGYGRTRLPAGRGADERRFREEMGTSATGSSASRLSMGDFYKELDEIRITKQTNIYEMRKPLVFWAYDDTVEQGRSYRYRIRLGVFNPIAGTDQLNEEHVLLKNNVILWSKFSNITESIEIPERLYFFPINVQQVAKVVTVKISKYVQGYWYGENFFVQQGEIIGRARENKLLEDEEEEQQLIKKEEIAAPETIDYTTGAVFVDVATVTDWSVGSGREPRAKPYSDMLYSFDGSSIGHIPIKMSFWPKGLQAKFAEIKKLEGRPRKPFRAWGSKADRGRGRRGRRDERDREESEEERFGGE
ncbi:MAG: hypothetical protein ACYS4W_02310 [Planctomycetota bacterium]|jgi:hypothetical protein